MKKLLHTSPLVFCMLLPLGCDDGTPAQCETASAQPDVAMVRKTLHLKVSGMSCSGCVNAIVKKVDGIEGVVQCDVSLENQSATIDLSDPGRAGEVEAAIRKLGYTVDVEDENPAS